MTEQIPSPAPSYHLAGWGYWGDIGATSPPSVRDNSGNDRSVNTPARQLSSVSATLTGTRITADVDHDGPQVLRERLVAYLTSATLEP